MKKLSAGIVAKLKPQLSLITAALIKYKVGLVGQSLSLAGMMLPILFNKIAELQFLIIVSAISGVLSYIGIWSIPSIYSSIKKNIECDVATFVSIITLVLTSLSVYLVSVAIVLDYPERSQIVLCAALLTFFQGWYGILITRAIREGRFDKIAMAKFLIGIFGFSLTLAACIYGSDLDSLVVAVVVSFALTATFLGWMDRHALAMSILRGMLSPSQQKMNYIRRYAGVNVGAFFAGLAFHVGSIAIARLGPIANPWVVVIRIVGGLSTTAQQVMAPDYEIRFSAAIREGRRRRAISQQWKAIIAGCSLSLFGCIIWFPAIFISRSVYDLDITNQFIVILCGVVFTFSSLVSSMIAKNLTLADGRMEYLVWAAGKAALGVWAIFAFDSINLLIAIVVIDAIFQAMYVFVAFVRVRLGSGLITTM